MHNLYPEFMEHIESENKEAALSFILSKLNSNDIDIVTLYMEVLSPALNNMASDESNTALIWKEHIRTSIIRTIIENCYPYVIKERAVKYKLKTNKHIAIVCPSEEYHEIGARMITDFFTLLGYDATFVGSNTPKDEFINALKVLNINYIALSISNYYNLVTAKNIIEKIKQSNSTVKIIVGGYAFKNNKKALAEFGSDIYIETFEDIKKLAEEDKI